MTQSLTKRRKFPDFIELEQLESLCQEVEHLKQEQQKQSQLIHALQEKERLLQLILDNIPQLIFWKDCNYVFQGCNRLWAEAAGLGHPSEVIGKTDDDIYKHPPNIYKQSPDKQNIDDYREQDHRVIDKAQAEYYLEYKPQKNVWYDTKKIPIKDSEGNVVGILATVENITERKKAEEALRIAEENYRSIFENALEGIFQSTPDGHYIRVNPAMARIHGYDSPEEMMAGIKEIGGQIYVDPSCREAFKRILEEKEELKDFEYQVYRQDGSIIWVEENTRAVRNAIGKVLYYEGIIQDITQRKRDEEYLRRQVEELRIEIDQQRRANQVAEITQTSYFQNLQAEVDSLRFDEDDF